MILKGYLFGIGYALICLLVSFVLYRLGLSKSYSRKIVHILVGFEWVILYHYLGAGIHFLLVCIFFLVLLSIAYKGRLLPMISSDSDNAPGTVYYAIAMTGVAVIGCFIPEVMLPFGIGVMCTSLGDGFAGVVGQAIKKCNPKIYANKTIFGSLTNLVVSTMSAILLSRVYSMDIGIINCILIGVLSSVLELITPLGFDNISVTWGTAAFAYFLMYFPVAENYLLPIVFSPIIILLSLSKKALTKDGILAAILLDIAVSVAFGNRGFIILCAFFVPSIIIDKIKKHNKNKGREDIEQSGSCRNYMQVIANGMVAFLSSVAFIITGKAIFTIPFVASLSEALSDTAASGIGSFSDKTFDPFRWKKCEKGLSGGMSVMGTFSSLFGAAFVSLIAFALRLPGYGTTELIIVLITAFLGSLLDSLLGSLLQVKYRCKLCGQITEREVHCDTEAERISGLTLIDNDIVNIISCAFSAILATAFALLL